MAQAGKITPTKAILLCINSMIAAGLFINTGPLTKHAGAFGFLGYLVAALILFPLILCIAELARLHPVAGGLYVYSKTYLGSWAGFLSGWAYFVGKTTSVALLMHKFVQFFQARSLLLQQFPTITIDFFMIFLLVLLNAIGVSVGGRVQYVFTALKATPILVAFGAGFFYFDPTGFATDVNFMGLLQTLPIAIFPLLGFEVICAIGNQIENSANNIKRVIITAFLVVACIDISFQLTSFGIMGHVLETSNEPILLICLKAFSNYPVVASLLNGAVFASILGACFSILTSNCWNLFTIAGNGHFPGKKLLTRINSFNVPWMSLVIEALLGCTILLISTDQVPLQNMSVFAQVISLLTCAVAAFVAVYRRATDQLVLWVPLLAIGSCCFVISICLQRILAFGVSFPFLLVFAIGAFAVGAKKLFPRL